jgi:hypothetical protein
VEEMSSEDTLSPTDRRFLDAVALVMELQSSDASLATATRTLWERLEQANGMRWTDEFERISESLMCVRELRTAMREEIARIRKRDAFLVLGR